MYLSSNRDLSIMYLAIHLLSPFRLKDIFQICNIDSDYVVFYLLDNFYLTNTHTPLLSVQFAARVSFLNNKFESSCILFIQIQDRMKLFK